MCFVKASKKRRRKDGDDVRELNDTEHPGHQTKRAQPSQDTPVDTHEITGIRNVTWAAAPVLADNVPETADHGPSHLPDSKSSMLQRSRERRQRKALRRKVRPTQGDWILTREMAQNQPEIARQIRQRAIDFDSSTRILKTPTF